MNCTDVTPDGVYIGEGTPIDCVRPSWSESVDYCAKRGCFWRKFHQLRADQFAKRAGAKQEEMRI